VVDRLIEIGDTVKAGQVLARLDPADYQLAVSAATDQVQAASVDAQQAASDEARLRRLLADGSVGAADHERQKARADAAAARLDQARRQLDLARNREGYATLVAPYAGVVTALRFERGQVVAEGQPVLSLARDGEREIVADLPEEWVGRARTLAAVAFAFVLSRALIFAAWFCVLQYPTPSNPGEPNWWEPKLVLTAPGFTEALAGLVRTYDGSWYATIAERGYDAGPFDAGVQHNRQHLVAAAPLPALRQPGIDVTSTGDGRHDDARQDRRIPRCDQDALLRARLRAAAVKGRTLRSLSPSPPTWAS